MPSLFSVYDFFSYVLAGGLVLAGTYWAFAELPHEPGAAAVFGIILLSYATGHLVQSAATVWEGKLWERRGVPSTVRIATQSSPEHMHNGVYDEALRSLISKRIAQMSGAHALSPADMFAIARTELRARQLDGRAELMNTMYGLCRGLTTACALLIPIFIAAAVYTDDWTRLTVGIALMVLASMLYFMRAQRYSYRFADQVWRDFAALPDPTAVSTRQVGSR